MSDMPLFWGGAISMHATSLEPWREVLTPLYTKCTQSQQGAKILYNTARFCAYKPTQGYRNRLSYPVSRLRSQLTLVPQTSGWGSQADSIYPTVSNPQPMGYMRPRTAMNVTQYKTINLLKTWVFLVVFVSVCVFNVWFKTTLFQCVPGTPKGWTPLSKPQTGGGEVCLTQTCCPRGAPLKCE